MLKTSARRGLVLLALAAAAGAAFAQKPHAATAAAPLNWPTKPLRIVVGFPPGSTPDLVARTIADPLAKQLGQPVIVDNRVGAGGNIAADIVARATDDHTIGVMINGNMTIAKLLNPKVQYDPQTAFQPLTLIATAPLLLAASNKVPGNDVQEIFLAGRNAGNKWSYGSPGVGTVGHIGMELLKTKTNIDPVHVPYPGNPQVINALVTGEIQLALLPPALADAQIKAGKLKAIGVTSAGRSSLVPQYPSLNEQGIRGFQLEIWTAAAAPKSMPAPIAAKLSTLIAEIVRSPDVRQKLFAQGWTAVGTNAEGLANRIKSDTALLGGVIMMRGIKAE
jgi:tripartite-type tricarboxylate transporter receptor subunit TctC